MPMCLRHYIKSLPDEIIWNRLMEKIAHTIHENFAWTFPFQG
jgi:hypothetical protein